MTDRDVSPERQPDSLDPIAALLHGETLLAANKLVHAETAFTTGLDNLHKFRLHIDTAESPTLASGLALVETSLLYERAETSRLQLCDMTSRFADRSVILGNYYEKLGMARADLDTAARAAVVAGDHRTMQDAEHINNALGYLLARSSGLLHMTAGLTVPQYMTDEISFITARDRLQLAYHLLSTGFWYDGLPTTEETQEQRHARIVANRSLDPQLGELLRMSESALAGSRVVLPYAAPSSRGLRRLRQRPQDMMNHPAFCTPGPRATDIFDFAVNVG